MPVIDSKVHNVPYTFNINSVKPSPSITSSYVRVQGSQLSSLFMPEDRTFGWYKLEKNTADFLENFGNGTNDGGFTYTVYPGTLFSCASLNGINQQFHTETTPIGSGITAGGFLGVTTSKTNSVAVTFLFEELPISNRYIWYCDGYYGEYTGIFFNSATGGLGYKRNSTQIDISVNIEADTIYRLVSVWDKDSRQVRVTVNNIEVLPWTDLDVTVLDSMAYDGWPVHLGLGAGSYVKMLCSNFRISTVPFSDNDWELYGTPMTFKVNLINENTHKINELNSGWVQNLNDYHFDFCVPPDFSVGNYAVEMVTASNKKSKKLFFNVNPLPIDTSGFDIDFTSDISFNNTFDALHKAWGGANGGVVKENLSIQTIDGSKLLVIESHGDLYTGTVQGVDNLGQPKFDASGNAWTNRVGGCVVSKNYCGFGSYETEAKVIPRLGVASAFWTFHYEEIYTADPRLSDFQNQNNYILKYPGTQMAWKFDVDTLLSRYYANINPTSYINIIQSSSTNIVAGSPNYDGTRSYALEYKGNAALPYTVNLPPDMSVNTFGMNVWYKYTKDVSLQAGRVNGICSMGTFGNSYGMTEVYVVADTPYIRFSYRGAGAAVNTGTAALTPNTWYMFTMTRKDNSVYCFKDSAPYGTLTVTEELTPDDYYLGSQDTVTGTSHTGARHFYVDNFFVCSSTLTNEDVSTLYLQKGIYKIYNSSTAEALHEEGSLEDGYYTVRNHEIDIEIPSNLPGQSVSDPSLGNFKGNTWRGESQNWDVSTFDGRYWEEYRDNYQPLGIDVCDGLFHKYRFDWYHDKVVFFIDDISTHTNYDTDYGRTIPDICGKYTVGNWFPSSANRWAGPDASWNVEYMYVKRIKYTPFTTENDLYLKKIGESYPKDGIREGILSF